MFVTVVEKDLDKKTAFWVRLMIIGSKTGCHQMHERSFSFFGYQFPVCARCTGLGIGQLFGFVISFGLFKENFTYLFISAILSILFLGIDGIGQYFEKWESTNLRRLITGFLCGFFVIIFLNKIIYEAIHLISIYKGEYSPYE